MSGRQDKIARREARGEQGLNLARRVEVLESMLLQGPPNLAIPGASLMPTLSQVVTLEQSVSQTSGPIPSAEELRKYEEVIPGFGKQCADNWIEESKFRRGIVDRQQTQSEREQTTQTVYGFLGMVSAWSLSAAALVLAGLAIWFGQGYAAVGIVGALGVFGYFVLRGKKTSEPATPPAPTETEAEDRTPAKPES